jgi:hypothetical protein
MNKTRRNPTVHLASLPDRTEPVTTARKQLP